MLAPGAAAHLVDRLDDETDWGRRLSPGEQQRLGFARVLLARPEVVFLDEATSALDEGLEHALYTLLREELPETVIVSVGHRSTLDRFHADAWSCRRRRLAGQHSTTLTARPPSLSPCTCRHVPPGLAHRLDPVSSDPVGAVAVQREPGGGDGRDRGHRVALDARDLHEPADRVAGQPEVVLHGDLGGVLDLAGVPPSTRGEPGGRHRAGRPDLALAAALGARDRRVGLEQEPIAAAVSRNSTDASSSERRPGRKRRQ